MEAEDGSRRWKQKYGSKSMEAEDVKMADIESSNTRIGETSSTRMGEISSSSIQKLLNKYSTALLPSTIPTILSASISSTSSSSTVSNSNASSYSNVFSTPAPASTKPLLFDKRPPLAFSSRITPRVRKAAAITPRVLQITKFEKGVQVNIIGNDENAPPGLQLSYEELKKEHAKTQKENRYLVNQIKRIQDESSVKAAFSAQQESPNAELKRTIEEQKQKIANLKRENDYLARQYKVLQESTNSNSMVKETKGGENMENVTICNTEYAVWKKPIGKGASCVVYKGFDKALDDMVAIKVVSLRKLNPKNTEEMRREIDLLKNLKDHDCIINLYDYELKKEVARLSLILEYGEMDLQTYLQSTPCLIKSPTKQTYYEVCLLWQQMLQAVQCIHSHSIVHKDLKPQNFMKVKGKLKLIDFGISQQIQDEVTSMIIQQPEGTPNYIAPEMLCGTFGLADSNVTGYRSDVYSLGCILFKLCFGVTPYQHIDKMQMKYYAIISKDEIEIPSSLKYEDISQILSRCLKKDRTQRPTVAELLEM